MKFSVELNCAPKQNTRFSSSLHIYELELTLTILIFWRVICRTLLSSRRFLSRFCLVFFFFVYLWYNGWIQGFYSFYFLSRVWQSSIEGELFIWFNNFFVVFPFFMSFFMCRNFLSILLLNVTFAVRGGFFFFNFCISLDVFLCNFSFCVLLRSCIHNFFLSKWVNKAKKNNEVGYSYFVFFFFFGFVLLNSLACGTSISCCS